MNRADGVSLALARARAAREAGAGLVEWRIDELAMEPGAEAAVLRLVRESPMASIVTCRPAWEGGRFRGDEAARVSLFEALLRASPPPRYLDVELAALEGDPRLERRLAALIAAQPEHARSGLILSSHDQERRPADLLRRIEAMAARPHCAVIKVAWRARSLRDNLEAFEVLAARHRPTIALCLGPFGLMSRVLAGKFGGLLTFAADSEDEATAPGQPSIADLRHLYRFQAIDAATRVYGIVGWPLGHSLSPVVHNGGFAAVGHNGVYLPLPVPVEYEHFKATMGALLGSRSLGFAGASVTVPHKEHLVRFVRESGGSIDELSERCGAANTLIVRNGGAVECMNSDGPALVAALCAGMAIEPAALRDLRVAVLGAGGAGRAAAAALARHGATIVLFNRTRHRAEAAARALSGQPCEGGGTTRVVVGRGEALGCGCFPVIVNATAVGLRGGPAPDASPLDVLAGSSVALDRTAVVLETVYAPRRTPLVAQAEAAGARTIRGDEMFLRQAALQFERWTGCPAPMELFRRFVASAP